MYEEVLHAMPDAKFVYTDTDPERWYDTRLVFGSFFFIWNPKPKTLNAKYKDCFREFEPRKVTFTSSTTWGLTIRAAW